MGKINNGTVSWLKRAKPAKTLGGSSLSDSMNGYIPNVTTVTRTDEICVRNAGEQAKECTISCNNDKMKKNENE